ncbi:MAG: HPF/RaiA family ribosome-associated protein [Luteococcus japonicus]
MPQSVNIRMAGGLAREDEQTVDETLAQIRRRLEALGVSGIQAEVSVKDRDAAGQHTTLEVWVPGQDRFVASSQHPDLRSALHEVGDRVMSQVNQHAERSEPRNNRQHRTTIRNNEEA